MVGVMVKDIPYLVVAERNATTHVLGFHTGGLTLLQTLTEEDAVKGRGVYHLATEIVGDCLCVGGDKSIKVQKFVEK